MMASCRFGNGCVFLMAAASLLYSCDTANTIDDPSKDYFTKYYGGDGDSEGVDVVIGKDSSIYLLGNTITSTNPNGKQLYLVKTDMEGRVVWQKTFGGKFDEQAKDLELTTDGRLVVLANSQKGATENDILVMTFTLDGIKIDSTRRGFQTTTLPSVEADENASSVSQTTDGFIVSGATTGVTAKGSGPEDVTDAFHLRLANNLGIYSGSWEPRYGTKGTDGATKVIQINSTTFYVFGFSNIDLGTSGTGDFNFWAYQLGATGGTVKGPSYPGNLVTNEKLTSVIESPPNSGEGFLLGGTSSDASGNYDIFINKLQKDLSFLPEDIKVLKPLSINLGKLDIGKTMVSVFPSTSTGYFLLTNEKSTSRNDFYLTKIENGGSIAWATPQIFGGQNDDYVGAVAELPNGKIILIGTMSIGDEGQKKMTLIKVNKDGKFLD